MRRLQGIGQGGRIALVLVDHPIAQVTRGQPSVGRHAQQTQPRRTVQVVENAPYRLTQPSQQSVQEFVAQRVLQATETGSKGVHPFGQRGI